MRRLLCLIVVLSLSLFIKTALAVEIPIIPSLAPEKSVDLDTPMTFMSAVDVREFGGIALGIRHAQDAGIKRVILRIQGLGGIMLSANNLAHAIQSAQKDGVIIDMEVIGPAYSAHAYITCFSNKTTIEEGASLMFHGAGHGDSILFGLIQFTSRDLDAASKASEQYMLQQCKTKGVLTDQNIVDINNNKEVTISKLDGKLIIDTRDASDSLAKVASEFVVSFMLLLVLIVSIVATVGFTIRLIKRK